jgi:hypothetical protein
MKISKQTMEILKNFSSINRNVMIEAGNYIHTRTVERNMYAGATIEDEFPKSFGIYDLSQLLGVISLFSEPELEFGESSLTISQGKNRVEYRYAAPEILAFPDKKLPEPSFDATFTLTEENLKSLLKAGAVLGSEMLRIGGDGSKITCTLLTLDKDGNPSTSFNTFSVDVGETDRNFAVDIRLENIKLMSGNYEVSLSTKRIARFANTGKTYTLYVANEKSSKWED